MLQIRENAILNNMTKYKIFTLKEKEELMKYYQQHGWKETYKKYKVSRASLAHWQARVKEAKPSDPHPLARRYKIRQETVTLVRELHKKQPTLSLEEIKQEVTKKRQSISRTTIWHIIKER